MTRINVVPVKELCDQHLFAEWRELPRIKSSLYKSLNRKNKPFSMNEIPLEYKMGQGHVKFFFNKLLYCFNRHKELTVECLSRGFKLNNKDFFYFKTDERFMNDYVVTEDALEINRKRIEERLPKKPRWTI